MQDGETRSQRFAIVTDSACDLPYEYFSEHDVALVPLHSRIDGTDLLDLVDIDPADFYVRLACSKGEATTSFPSPSEFKVVYQRLVDEGAKAIVSVHVSSALSGTVASARTAAREASRSVRCEVLDTLTASAAEGMVVCTLVAARDAGLDVDEALARAQAVVDAVELYFILAPGRSLTGRHRASMSLHRLLAGMTGARPLLYLDDAGQVAERSSSVDVTDSTGLVARIMSLSAARLGPLRYVEISAGMPRELAALEKPLDTNEFLSSRMAVANACPSIVSHVGLGAMGIAFAPVSCLAASDDPSEPDPTSCFDAADAARKDAHA